MKKKIKYEKAPKDIALAIDEAKIIHNFFVSPDKLLKDDEAVKITIALSKYSVDFFKQQAKASRVPYQKMLRKVIDLYVNFYNQKEIIKQKSTGYCFNSEQAEIKKLNKIQKKHQNNYNDWIKEFLEN